MSIENPQPRKAAPYVFEAAKECQRAQRAGELAFDPMGLEIVLGLSHLQGGRVGPSILHKIFEKRRGRDSPVVLKKHEIVLFGPAGSGKTSTSVQIGHEIVKQTGEEVDFIRFEDAMSWMAKQTGRPREEWSHQEWTHCGERTLERIERSRQARRARLIDIPGVGDIEVRDRGNNTLRELARNIGDDSFFMGFIPDPRVQDFAAKLREEVSRIDPIDVVRFLKLQMGIEVAGMHRNSLFNLIVDQYRRGEIVKNYITRAGRREHIEKFNEELVRLGFINANRSGQLLTILHNDEIYPPINVLDKITQDRFRLIAHHMEQYTYDELGLRRHRNSVDLVVNPARHPGGHFTIFQFIPDEVVIDAEPTAA